MQPLQLQALRRLIDAAPPALAREMLLGLLADAPLPPPVLRPAAGPGRPRRTATPSVPGDATWLGLRGRVRAVMRQRGLDVAVAADEWMTPARYVAAALAAGPSGAA